MRSTKIQTAKEVNINIYDGEVAKDQSADEWNDEKLNAYNLAISKFETESEAPKSNSTKKYIYIFLGFLLQCKSKQLSKIKCISCKSCQK